MFCEFLVFVGWVPHKLLFIALVMVWSALICGFLLFDGLVIVAVIVVVVLFVWLCLLRVLGICNLGSWFGCWCCLVVCVRY